MPKTGIFGYSSSGGGGGGSVSIITPPVTPSAQNISGTVGVTLPTIKSMTFIVYAGTLLINGVSFGRGTYTYGNGSGTVNSLNFDASGSSNTVLMFQS